MAYIYYRSQNKPLAKALRRNATRQERHLWYDFLSRYPVRFYRQKQIGPYIVDFYCAKANLVVELDGSQHYFIEKAASDEERTAYLASHGLHLLRFSNLDVDQSFAEVCEAIDNFIREHTNHLPPK